MTNSRNEPEFFAQGLEKIRHLCSEPFSFYTCDLELMYDDFGRPLLGIPFGIDPDLEDATGKTGFLTEFRWPEYNVQEMSVNDDLPNATFAAATSSDGFEGVLAQIEVVGVIDKGILGPFDNGTFVWKDDGSVQFYDNNGYFIKRSDHVGVTMTLDNDELAKLNQTIGNSFNTGYCEDLRISVDSMIKLIAESRS